MSRDLLQHARHLARIGWAERAANAYRIATRQLSGDDEAEAWLGLGGIQSDLGDTAGALQSYALAARSHRLESQAVSGAGLALHKGGSLVEARDHHTRAAAIARERGQELDWAQAVAWRAEVMVQLGEALQAEQELRGALAETLPPGCSYWLHAALGEVLRLEGRLEEARDAYRVARDQLDDGLKQPVNAANLALTELALGDGQAARIVLEPVRTGLAGTGTLFEATVEAIWLAVLAQIGAFSDLRAVLDGTLAIVENRGVAERDVAWALHHAGSLAEGAGEDGLAVRCIAAALNGWVRLGVDDEVERCEGALERLHRRGAPVPVGRWEVGRRLGEGGMGEVRLAQGPMGGVAVKILKRKGGARLEREVRAVASLDHPNITAVLDVGTVGRAAACMLGIDPEAPFFAMELANDGSLAERAGWMDWEALRDALAELLLALAHAHARGLVHLDIKPENVLIDRGVVKLADFGVARGYGDAREVCGTPAFMAPEVIRGREVGARADLYAVGCLAWTMACGRVPFEGAPKDVLYRQLQEPLPPLQAVTPMPEGLDGWIRRLTAKTPAARFRSAMCARDALLEVAGRSRGEGSPPPGGVAGRVTWLFNLEVPSLPPEVDDVAEPEPPRALPPSWRLPRRGPQWSGPALFRWRRPPLVGRDEEMDRLWAEALRCQAGGVRVVSVLGPPKSGRTRLVQELAERLREVDGPLATVVDGGAPPADPEGLVLVVGDHPAADRYIHLEPIGRESARALVRDLVPLSEELLRSVIDLTDGDPAFLLELLAHWVEHSWLAPSRHGVVLRPGHRADQLPERLRAQALARFGSDEEDLEIGELLAIMSPCGARELGRGCWAAGLPPPRPTLKALEANGLIRQSGSRLALLPVLRRSLEHRARVEARDARWHRIAAEIVSDPVARARHLLGAREDAAASEALVALVRETEGSLRGELAADALVALDRQLVDEDDPRRAELHGICLESAFERFDARAMAVHARQLARSPEGHERLWMAVQAARRLGRLGDARRLLDYALRRPPRGNSLAILLGEAAMLAQCVGDWDDAERRLEEGLLYADGEAAINLLVMRTAVAAQQEDPRAVGYLAQAVARLGPQDGDDTHAAVANAAAQLARADGRLDEAEDGYARAARLWSGDRRCLARLNLGLVRLERGDVEGAGRDALELASELEARGSKDFAVFAMASALPWAARVGGRLLEDTLARFQLLQRETGAVEQDMVRVVARARQERDDPRLVDLEARLRKVLEAR